MSLLCCWISSVWLLLFLTACTCSDITVNGFEGQDVTLACKYDSVYHGKCEICWMRGDIPPRGCGQEIIATDGEKVERRTSARYQLNGEIQKGDVSLTILNITQHDTGQYGCRVHVPGLFNDKKYVVKLVIKKAPVTTAPVTTTNVTSSSSTSSDIVTVGTWNSETTQVTANFSTAISEISMHVDDYTEEMLPAVVVSVVLLLLVWGTVVAYLMYKKRLKSRTALEIAQLSDSTAIYNNVDSTLGLQNRAMVVENIYQIDTENEYERWS